MVSEKQESLLSVDDAADSIGVTKQTVTRLIREEKLPAQKVGNKWVLREEALRDYMRDNNLVPEPKDHGCLMSEKPGIVALSFFSGALGLDLGMEAAGIEPLLYCENDRKCRMTIQAMRPHGALIGDINQYSATEILQMAGLESNAKVDVMFGGPPCQAFSTAGARRAFDDARGNVFLKYLELASEIKPTYLVMHGCGYSGIYIAFNLFILHNLPRSITPFYCPNLILVLVPTIFNTYFLIDSFLCQSYN